MWNNCTLRYNLCITFLNQQPVRKRGVKGRDPLIEETVKAVKEAEASAKDLIAKAKEEAEAILKDAESKAEALKTDAADKAKECRAQRLAAADEEGKKILSESEEESKRSIEALKLVAGNNEKDAIETVLRKLI